MSSTESAAAVSQVKKEETTLMTEVPLPTSLAEDILLLDPHTVAAPHLPETICPDDAAHDGRPAHLEQAQVKAKKEAPDTSEPQSIVEARLTPYTTGAAGEDVENGVGILSEEQTQEAIVALQEATTMIIEAAMGHPLKEEEPTPSLTSNSYNNFAVTGEEEGALKQEAMLTGENNNSRKRKEPEGEPPTREVAGPETDNGEEAGEGREAEDPALPAASPPKRRVGIRVSWDDRIDMLRKYKEEHGDLLIPIRYKKNPSLGKFVHNTREQFKLFHKRTPPGYKKKCSLTAARIEQLDQLGFVWATERVKRQNEDWQSRLDQLKAYKEKHGNCLVPHGYEEDPAFAEWIHRQRTTYASMLKEKKPSPMVEARMKQLADIGFNFTVHEDKWLDYYNMLKTYHEKQGHCQVPTHFAEQPKLGRWVHTQRHQRRLQLRGKKSCMSDERVEMLNKLGFSWEVRPSLERPRATWQQRFDELKEFVETQGHFLVPVETHPHLHAWCHEQKQRLRNIERNRGQDPSKRMGPARVKALQEIGFTHAVELAASSSSREGDKSSVEAAEDSALPQDEAALSPTGEDLEDDEADPDEAEEEDAMQHDSVADPVSI